MEKLFGIPLPTLMFVLSGIFIVTMLVVIGMAVRNPVMLKLGIRPISRRPGMTALIIIGVMLSTIIISAAFGTADTLTYSIRDIGINGLGTIDELIISARSQEGDRFGQSFISMERYEQIRDDLADDDRIDGIMPQFTQSVPAVNPVENLSEGQLNLLGIDPALVGGFGGLRLAKGGNADVQSLGPDETFINQDTSDELDLASGGEIEVYVQDGAERFVVKGVLENGGFAGIDPTMIIRLDRAQEMFGRTGQITSIVISNRGDSLTGNELSEEVTKDLRVKFTDRETASRLKDLLNNEVFLRALELERDTSAGDDRKERLTEVLTGIRAPDLTDELIDALADTEISGVILDVLDSDDMRDIQREATTLFSELAEMYVLDIKNDILRGAEQAGTAISVFFLTFSTFSIASGILLIFLIFVLLAGARKSEMGMARAVGAKRRNLIEMFVFEGTAYALVSAAIGVLLGLAVSALMIGTLNSIFSSFEDDFTLKLHFTLPTIVVSYCLGMIITFATVGISAYRVSYLNIVAAVRNLPENLVPTTPPGFLIRLLDVVKGIFRPFLFLWRALRYLIRRDFVPAVLHVIFPLGLLGMIVFWVVDILIGRDFVPGALHVVIFPLWLLSMIVWVADILIQLFKLVWPYLLRGWLLVLLGVALVGASLVLPFLQLWSAFGGGVSLTLAGLGLLARNILTRGDIPPGRRDRIVFTATGIAILVFWALPPGTVDRLLGDVADEMGGDVDIMFVSGIAMVGAAVWTVMYNADLILQGLHFITSRLRQLRPVLVTAIAYPLSSKFRTGLTLAMFALVIFTLTVMSVLTDTFGTQFVETRVATGGWDIEGDVNFTTPIDDIRSEIDGLDTVDISDFEAIGGYTQIPMQVREIEADDQEWNRVALLAADEGYLESSEYDFKLIADGFGSTTEDVFEAMRNDSSLVVIGGSLLSDTQGEQGEQISRAFHEVSYDDESMSPIEIELREPSTRAVMKFTVIGVIDRVHDTGFVGLGMIGSKTAIDEAAPFPIPITTYRFRVKDLDESKDIARNIERAFLENGMQTVVLEEFLNEQLAALRGFFQLFTGFMALGLFVGIAALGVVSTRAVVERRQQIGMLRAIGYRRGMIQLSFLIESSFVAVLGIIIGTALGLVLSYNAVIDIRDDEGLDTIRYAIPWIQMIVILGLTYIFSLLATYIPARQASKVYPAEALRYE